MLPFYLLPGTKSASANVVFTVVLLFFALSVEKSIKRSPVLSSPRRRNKRRSCCGDGIAGRTCICIPSWNRRCAEPCFDLC